MDIRLTFDGVVETYERARPSYPDEIFDLLFAALPANPELLEIGPGTGQATVELLARGAAVTAVELGPNLAARLRERFQGNDQLQVVNAAFEDAPVPRHHFDAVTVATAFHWVTQEAQLSRPVELLKPGGVLGVIDLIQPDSSVDQGYYDRVQPIYDKFGGSKSSFERKTHDTVEPKQAPRLRASALYDSVSVHRVRWDQTYTTDGYRDLLWTHSGTQMMPEPQRTQMVDELVAVVEDEFDGSIIRPLVATLILARVAA